MRVSTEPLPHAAARRRGSIVLALLALLVVLIVVIQGLAGFYVNYLWFEAAHVGVVWRSIVVSKLGIAGTFVTAAFALVWASLWLADKITQRTLFLPTDSELVRRYHAIAVPHAFVLRTAVALLVALALGTGTTSQWQQWLLFEHAVPFGRVDPIFNRDASFFVFRLPFLSFLADWLMVALVVTFLLSALAHFLSGTIRLHGPRHIEPRAIAHLSLLLGAMALVRAWAYYFVDRYAIDLNHGPIVGGVSYIDDQVRLPAMTLLAVVSLIAFVMLVFNVYQRNLALPALALGLWALVALAIGVIYPAVDQAVSVTPAESRVELPFVTENAIQTRYAMGIGSVTQTSFPAATDLSTAALDHYRQTLSDVALWNTTEASQAFAVGTGPSYYGITDLSENRIRIGSQVEPVIIGVRELESSNLDSPTWENERLVYTHGYGAVVAAQNAADDFNPVYELSGLPPRSARGGPQLSSEGAEVYFAPEQRHYVIVDSKAPRLDYSTGSPTGTNTTGSYKGTGAAVSIGGLAERLAFAVKLRDFSLLVSGLLTNKSKILYLTGIEARVQKALPFLHVDTHPYAVIADKRLYWVVNAYATSAYYPDAQPADTAELGSSSALQGDYNYVRDAAVAVVDAESGQMGFYALDGADPLVTSYERTYPNLLQPYSGLARLAGGAILRQLRYPQDLLSVQAAMYGAYGTTGSSAASSASNRLTPASAPASDPADAAASSVPSVYRPQYELIQLSADAPPSYELVEPLAPYSADGNGAAQNLSVLLLASSDASASDPSAFGQLTALVMPGSSVDGPARAASYAAAKERGPISQLATGGAQVSYGTIEAVPVADALLWVEPVYLELPGSSVPEQRGVIVVYGGKVDYEPTATEALDSILGAPVEPSGSRPSSGALSVSAQVRADIAKAAADYAKAEKELAARNGVAYLGDLEKAGKLTYEAQKLIAAQSKRARTSASRSRTAAAHESARVTTTTVIRRNAPRANA